jgi:hypothetical protein
VNRYRVPDVKSTIATSGTRRENYLSIHNQEFNTWKVEVPAPFIIPNFSKSHDCASGRDPSPPTMQNKHGLRHRKAEDREPDSKKHDILDLFNHLCGENPKGTTSMSGIAECFL